MNQLFSGPGIPSGAYIVTAPAGQLVLNVPAWISSAMMRANGWENPVEPETDDFISRRFPGMPPFTIGVRSDVFDHPEPDDDRFDKLSGLLGDPTPIADVLLGRCTRGCPGHLIPALDVMYDRTIPDFPRQVWPPWCWRHHHAAPAPTMRSGNDDQRAAALHHCPACHELTISAAPIVACFHCGYLVEGRWPSEEARRAFQARH